MSNSDSEVTAKLPDSTPFQDLLDLISLFFNAIDQIGSRNSFYSSASFLLYRQR